MVMRIGGLASGMDIDSLVEKLMQAERAPLNKLQQKKQTYEWQRDAYRDVNKKLKTFDTYIADNLVLKSFIAKTASSSNSSLVSATATGQATGTISIEGVSQLASSSRGIGNQVSANGTTKLSSLMAASGQTMPAEMKLSAIKSDGTMSSDVAITLDENMTVDEFVSKINSSNAGVSAIFESGKLSITAKNAGDNKSGAEVKVSTGGGVFKALGFANITGDSGDLANNGKNAVFQVNGIATERSTNNFSINGYNITLNSTFNANKTTAERYNTALLEWKNTHNQDFDTELTNAGNRLTTATTDYNTAVGNQNNKKQALFGNLTNADYENFNKIGNLSFVEKALDKNYLSEYNEIADKDTYDAKLSGASLTEAEQYLKDNNISYEQYNAMRDLGEAKLENLSKSSYFNTLEEDFVAGLTNEEKELLKNIQSPSLETSGLNTQIDNWANSVNSDPVVSQNEKALAAKLSNLSEVQKSALTRILKDVDATNPTASSALNPYTELATANKQASSALTEKQAAETQHQQLTDRKATAETNFETAYKAQTGNDLQANEDVASLQEVTVPTTSSNAVTLSSTSNIDDMVNKVKDFVTTYNTLIKGLSDQTKESKYRDYAPLTTEQRKEMDEDEIKLWEEKAKSGLLRSDSMIRNGLSDMRSIVYQSNPAIEDTRFNTLFSIGITTSKSYNDGGTLEIDETKLRKALEENPDAVEKLFKNVDGQKSDPAHDGKDTRGYLEKLRESMKTLEVNIEKKAGRSTMTDAQFSIGKSLIDNETRITNWQRKLEDIEARYWKQFTAMESAINKANQQSSIFAQG